MACWSTKLGTAVNRSGRKSYNSRPELRMSSAPGLGLGSSAAANIICLFWIPLNEVTNLKILVAYVDPDLSRS